jgi:hypothetical protein
MMVEDLHARIAQLETENASLRQREGIAVERAERAEIGLAEALEQQTALSDVLNVIASSPSNLQPVLNAVIQTALRISRSTTAWIAAREGDEMVTIAATAGFAPGMMPGIGRRFRLAERRIAP